MHLPEMAHLSRCVVRRTLEQCPKTGGSEVDRRVGWSDLRNKTRLEQVSKVDQTTHEEGGVERSSLDVGAEGVESDRESVTPANVAEAEEVEAETVARHHP